MGVDTYLRCESASEHRPFESAVIDGVVAVCDDRVDVRSSRKEAVHSEYARRRLVVFVSHECSLLQLGGDGFDTVQSVEFGYLRCVCAERSAFGRQNQQFGIKLGEHVLDECAETVHHGEHTDHSRRNHRHRHGGDARDDVDGVVPFLGEKVSPGYEGFGASHEGWSIGDVKTLNC